MPPAARTHTIAPPTPELLTESFCERCGTRYTFESEAPKARRPGLGRARVLTRGLKNWVVEDGRSIEAAMADARRDEERGLASAQLEAFHQTFNFCMDCRQYTCMDCWNQAEGRCQTCAPLPEQIEGLVAVNGADAPMAWPTTDLSGDEAAEAAAAAAMTAEAAEGAAAAAMTAETAERAAAAAMAAEAASSAVPYMPTDLRPVDLPDDEVEMMVGAADAAAVASVADVGAETPEVAAPEGETSGRGAFLRAVAAASLAADKTPEVPQAAAEVVAAQDSGRRRGGRRSGGGRRGGRRRSWRHLPRSRPSSPRSPRSKRSGSSKRHPSRSRSRSQGLVAAEAVVAAEPAPEPEPEPIPTTRTPTPGWTIVAPDGPETEAPSGAPAWPPRAPVYQPPPTSPAAPPPMPGQPGQPSWPTLPPAAFSVPAAQAVWEESSLGVISRPGSGVQACVSCGLPLSAAARFCRRCGSRQG